MPQLRPARIASLALLIALSTTAAAEEPPSSQGLPPLDSAPANTSAWMPPRGLYLQAHVHLLSGWSLEDRAEGTTTLLELTPGAGIGLRLGYDFTQHVGAFASVEADVESEGPYAGYGAGAILRAPMMGRLRLNALLGARLITPVAPLIYATAGVSAEFFLSNSVALGLEVDAAFPLGSGTRDTGDGEATVSAQAGPMRGIISLTWYPGG